MEVTISGIEGFLKTQSVDVKMQRATEEIPLDHLILRFGVDERNRPQSINLYVIEKELGSLSAQKKKGTKATFIHLYMVLPIQIQDEAVGDIARYIMLINKALEFEGFGMSEVDRMIYFRHDLHCSQKQLSDEVLMGLIGYILLIVDTFSPHFERIASTETTFLETVQQVMKQS
jgi:hypothetical protein